jgi:hypothetical protein
MTIDLDTGSISAKEFDLVAGKLTLSSNLNKNPIQVDSDNDFWVDWSGNVHCTNLQASGGSFTGTIHASSGEFTGDITGATGTFSGLVSGGSININDAFIVEENGTLTIGGADTFQVTSGGALTCTSATIGGWTVSGGDGGFTSTNFSMDPVNGLSFNTNFNVDSAGTLTAVDADISGKIKAAEGEIGGWIIGDTTLSSTGVTLDSSASSISVGGITLDGDGFLVGGVRAVTDAVIAWTGWTQGFFNRLEFVNGILVSMSGGGGSGGV